MSNTKPFDYTLDEIIEAFQAVKKNNGAAGIDRQSLEDFERHLDGNLYKICNRMASGSYFPPPVRAISIPKKSGGDRILGIPTVGDRIAQTVVKRRLERLLEPAFHSDSYGFRPSRSAHQAVAVTRKRCWQYPFVVEFDIVKLFDNLDHQRLMRALRHHTSEKSVLLYVERWLRAPMMREDEVVHPRVKGTPQGGVISPLLANLFLHYAFDMWMVRRFSELKFCRYADDALVHCRTLGEAKRVLGALTSRLEECDLRIHPEKTSIVCCQRGKGRNMGQKVQFTFLGFTFMPRCCEDKRTGEWFTGFAPAMSRAAEKSIREHMRKMPFVSLSFFSLQDIAKQSRSYIQGWMNYYCRFFRSRFQRVASYFNALLIKWAMQKFKHLRGRRGKAQVWLSRVAVQSPNLFPHWKCGWTRMAG